MAEYNPEEDPGLLDEPTPIAELTWGRQRKTAAAVGPQPIGDEIQENELRVAMANTLSEASTYLSCTDDSSQVQLRQHRMHTG